MLVISRKVGEKIMIGDDIVITLADIEKERCRCRIGIEAPRAMPVWREEIQREIDAKKVKACE